MAHATVATEVHQALDRHGDFTTEVTLGGELANLGAETVELIIGEVFDLLGGRDTRGLTNQTRAWAANTVDGCEANLCVLMAGNVNSGDTGHLGLPP
jgi:hypothetical protein